MIKRNGSARWQGSLRDGSGTLSTQSGTLSATPYSFQARFGDRAGTNPEELVAAAHAGCFTMALGFTLANAGFVVEAIETGAVVTMDLAAPPTITAIHLTTRARVAAITAARFVELAAEAKAGCLISRALSPAIEVSLDAALAA